MIRIAHNGFNPRAHAGRDPCQAGLAGGELCFNPRAHAGRDSLTAGPRSPMPCFNPRAHAGRDLSGYGYNGLFEVSIHAPTRGATQRPGRFGTELLFQSTRPRGARRF